MGILRGTERSMMRAMCGELLKDRRCTDLMFMLGCVKPWNSVRWYGHALRREDGHVLRRALDFEVDGQRKKGKLKRAWKKLVEEESVKIGLRMEDVFCRLKWSVGVNQIAAGLR